MPWILFHLLIFCYQENYVHIGKCQVFVFFGRWNLDYLGQNLWYVAKISSSSISLSYIYLGSQVNSWPGERLSYNLFFKESILFVMILFNNNNRNISGRDKWKDCLWSGSPSGQLGSILDTGNKIVMVLQGFSQSHLTNLSRIFVPLCPGKRLVSLFLALGTPCKGQAVRTVNYLVTWEQLYFNGQHCNLNAYKVGSCMIKVKMLMC